MTGIECVDEQAAIAAILGNRGAMVPWVGAGVSVEAGVLSSLGVCERLSIELWEIQHGCKFDDKLHRAALKQFREEKFQWDKNYDLYATVLREAHATPAARNAFFREIAHRREPSFAHFALAILMRAGILAPECLTTNFDKLLEKAFVRVGETECQPIRDEREDRFMVRENGQYFCFKLHGDYDTLNAANVGAEISFIDPSRIQRVKELLRARGLVVLGSTGYGESISTLLRECFADAKKGERLLERGLYWGVYVGSGEASTSELGDSKLGFRDRVDRAIKRGEIVPRVADLLREARTIGVLVRAFPVYGSGDFLWKLIKSPQLEALRVDALPYLDHHLRIREVFKELDLPDEAIKKHQDKLEEAKKRPSPSLANASGEWHCKRIPVGNTCRVSMCYGDISTAELLTEGIRLVDSRRNDRKLRAAILTPDDTCISIGGGAALSVSTATRQHQAVLHDVHKLAPVPPGDVLVSSAGRLPVHYLFHGASLAVRKGGSEVRVNGELRHEYFEGTAETIASTMTNALLNCFALRVDALFVPLLATGVAGVDWKISARAMLDAIRYCAHPMDVDVIFVLFDKDRVGPTAFLELVDAAATEASSAGL